MRSYDATAIILCGGKGTRTGSKLNKVLCYFGAKTALEYCLDAFSPFCKNIIVTATDDDKAEITEIATKYGASVVLGGETRTQSVKNGLQAVGDCDVVVIHDGARPFVSAETVRNCIESAHKYGSGIAAAKVTDTIKKVADGVITSEIDRDELYCMHTPQAFSAAEIKKAYNSVSGTYNDDSAVYAAAGFSPRIVIDNGDNKKITYPQDLFSVPPCQRIGLGVDFHRFAENRPLILGGVTIPYKYGLIGNSDADVLTHAVMDALLSAIGEPDIGVLFPCTDEYRGADSIKLLKTVKEKIDRKNRKIIGISATIMAQAPKMRDYIPDMRKRISETLCIGVELINISATTTEGLGVIGEGKGIASSAMCLIQ